MKLCLSRETLLKSLQVVIGVVDRKHMQPILSNVLLDAQKQRLSITATDLEIELISHAELDAQLDQPCRVTLPGRKLVDICRALPDNAAIELHSDKERVLLRSGSSRFVLSTLPADHFPNVTVPTQEGNEFTLPGQQLFDLLHRTAFAMAQEDVRYYLNGLLFEVHDHALSVVATDGHRLAKNTAPIQANGIEQTSRTIVPYKAVLELSRLLSDHPEAVHVLIGENHIHVSSAYFKFTSKLIEGRFPSYDRVIPSTGTKQFSIDRDQLKQALIRTAILCNEKFRGIHLELRNNLLRLSANNPEQEASEDELTISYAHEDLNIGLNVRYLLDIIQRVTAGDLIFTFSDSGSGILIQESNPAYQGIFVVMPMRL